MSLMISKWRPSWWTADVHGSAWERAKFRWGLMVRFKS